MDKVRMGSLPLVSILLLVASLLLISVSIFHQTSIMSAYAQTNETGEEQDTTEIQATIVELIDYLNLINIEYIDAVSGGKITNQEQYDEAVFYVTTALRTFNGVKEDLNDIAAQQAIEVGNDLKKTSAIVQNNGDDRQVSNTLQHAKQKLNEVLVASGATVEPIDGWALIDSMNEALDQMVTSYKEGSYEEARTLAREAYLDNFELIETDIAEENRMLMERIESSVRVDLVNMIDNRRSASEIEDHVEQIKADLEQARAVTTPEFPLVALALMTLMVLVVGISRTRAVLIPFR